MKNTNIKLIAFTSVTALFLSACGGGSKSTSSFPDAKVPDCGTAADKGKSLAADVTAKTIEKVIEGAQVRIWHSPDGTKLACMISGEANIVD